MTAEPRPASEAVVVECDLDVAPDTVWRALTEPALLADWLFEGDPAAANDFEALSVAPGQSLVYAWRESAAESPPQRPSTVTFTVAPNAGGGARLRIVHEAPPAARAILPPAPIPCRAPIGARPRRGPRATMRWAA